MAAVRPPSKADRLHSRHHAAEASGRRAARERGATADRRWRRRAPVPSTYYPKPAADLLGDDQAALRAVHSEAGLGLVEFLAAAHPQDRERVVQAGISAADAGPARRVRVEFRTIGAEDGRERWIAARGRMLFDGARRAGSADRHDAGHQRAKAAGGGSAAARRRAADDHGPRAGGLFTAHDPECREVTVNRMANSILETPEGSYSWEAPGGRESPRTFFRDGVEVPTDQLPLQMAAARGIEVQDAELGGGFAEPGRDGVVGTRRSAF